MAAKPKRFTPSPEELIGAIPVADPGNVGVSTIVGRAAKPSGSNALQQVGAQIISSNNN